MPQTSIRNIAFALAALVTAGLAQAQAPAAATDVFHLVGMPTMKEKAKGKLTVADGAMKIAFGKSSAEVKTSMIEDIDVGTETTQAGGKAGTTAKTAAIAAPYGSGAALTLLLRTKVDLLTIIFRGADGGLHGALFSVPKGQAMKIRDQLVGAGAHAKERKS